MVIQKMSKIKFHIKSPNVLNPEHQNYLYIICIYIILVYLCMYILHKYPLMLMAFLFLLISIIQISSMLMAYPALKFHKYQSSSRDASVSLTEVFLYSVKGGLKTSKSLYLLFTFFPLVLFQSENLFLSTFF